MESNEVDDSLFPNEADAKEADSIWDAGREEAAKGQPEGSFQCKITKAELGRSNSSGRMQIHYELEVLTGNSAGAKLQKYDGLGTPKQASMTQQQLTRIGVDLAGIGMSKLPAVLSTLIDRVIAVTGKKNGDFYNIYFNKAVDTAVGSDAPDSSPFG